jgi:hypothetical protein
MKNGSKLPLDRCPHCRIATPHLVKMYEAGTTAFDNTRPRKWFLHGCESCGGVVLTEASTLAISRIWPEPVSISETVPARAREYLRQAADSLYSPSGAVMLTASAVDAMLKDKGFKEGSLYSICRRRSPHYFRNGRVGSRS